jgi:hypothetical protein
MTTIKSDVYECSNCHLIFAVPITSKKDITCLNAINYVLL